MWRDLDSVLNEGVARISVFGSDQWQLLPCDVECCHGAKHFCHHSSNSSACIVNSGYQLPLKHSTALCAVDHPFVIQVMLEDGFIKSSKTSESLCWQKAYF